MTDLNKRLAESTKEELIQVVQTITRVNAITRRQVMGIISYLNAHKAAATDTSKRRSSRRSTRVSSEDYQDSTIQLHPRLQEVFQTVEQSIQICALCSKAFDEKNNNERSCRRHDGHWLIEVETSDTVEFVRASTASSEILKANANWIMSCCCASKNDVGEGCVSAKHVALIAKNGDGDRGAYDKFPLREPNSELGR